MNNIKNWLESKEPDYNVGLQLFIVHNRNRAIYNYLVRVGEMRGMSKLTYELQKLAKVAPQIAQKEETPVTEDYTEKIVQENERLSVVFEGKIKREDLPEQLQTLAGLNISRYESLLPEVEYNA